MIYEVSEAFLNCTSSEGLQKNILQLIHCLYAVYHNRAEAGSYISFSSLSYTIDIPCIFITYILGEALEVRLHQVCVLFLNWTLVHNMADVAIPLEFIYSVAICCTLPT